MNKELKIKIKVDKDTGAVKVVGDEFDTLNTKTKSASIGIKDVTKSLGGIAAGVGSIYLIKEAFEFAIKSGFSFNNSLEQSTQGLTALTVATSSNISALGKHLTLTDKYSLATIEATKSVKDLQKINADTPHSLNQTNQIYKAMYVSMKKAGASNSEMINITKKMSIAAGSAEIEFNSLLAGVDGLATGTVLANSDLGRFLSGLGLTNQALKESDDVVKLLEDRLSQFKAADTMNVAVSNLTNSWDQLAGTMTEDIFEDVKEGAKELSGFLDDLNKDVKLLKYWFAEPADLKTLDDVENKIADVTRALSENNSKIKGSFFEDLGNGRIFGETHYKKNIKELNEELTKLIKKRSELIEDSEKNKDSLVGSSSNKNTDKTVKLSIKTTMDSAAKEFYAQQDKLTTIEQSLNITIEDDPFYEVSLKYANLRDTVALNPLHTQVQLDLVDDALINEISIISAKKIKIEAELEIANLDSMDSMTDLLDLQSSLADSSDRWATNIKGVSGALLQAGKSFSDIDKDKKKRESADLKAQKKYAKAYLEANGDVYKEKKASSEFDATQSKIRESEMDSYIGAFSNLSAAVSSYGEQSSTAAKVAIAAEQGLAVVQGVRAVIRAWGDPYPLNLVTVPLTMAAVGGLLGQIGASGGGGGSAPKVPQSEINQVGIDNHFEPMLEKADIQIDLLEAIKKNGSAEQLTIEKTKVEYDYAMATYINEMTSDFREEKGLQGRLVSRYETPEQWENYLKLFDNLNSKFGADLWTSTEREDGIKGEQDARLNKDLIQSNEDFLRYVGVLFDNNAGFLVNWGSGNNTAEENKLLGVERIFEMQNLMADFAKGSFGSLESLVDYKEDVEDMFDSITNTSKYAELETKKAYETVSSLIGDKSFSSFIEENISLIRELENSFTNAELESLFSTNPKDFLKQQDTLYKLNTQLGTAYETNDKGLRELINSMDSFELVAEAMETSVNNINSFVDSFKNDEELLGDMASNLGVDVATNIEELSSLFEKLASDTVGLTDAEAELLSANKSIIEQTNEYADSISTLEGVFTSLETTIDKLRGYSQTADVSLAKFYTTLNTAKDFDITDEDGYASVIKDLVSSSNIFNNTDLFTSTADMTYAQLSAANQLEDLEIDTRTQIDYLAEIEENTRMTYESLLAQLSDIGKSLVTNSTTSSNTRIPTNEPVLSEREQYVRSLYQDILGREGELTGVDYWTSSDLTRAEISSGFLNSDEYLNNKKYTAFAEGGLIKGGQGGVFGHIGEESHDELIVPLKNDPLHMKKLLQEIQSLKNEVRKMREDNNHHSSNIAENTRTGRFNK